MSRIERALFAAGAVCLTWYGVGAVRAAAEQKEQRALVRRTLATAPTTPTRDSHWVAVPGSPIGELVIQRLNLSAAIIEGETDQALKAGIGHLSDTPMPWQPGNFALAAHRDSIFRPLKNVRPGDVVEVKTPRGSFRYQVRSTVIVNPDDVWVLKAADRPTLTLITCYPFNFIGSAPQRFVVQADRIDTPPTSN